MEFFDLETMLINLELVLAVILHFIKRYGLRPLSGSFFPRSASSPILPCNLDGGIDHVNLRLSTGFGSRKFVSSRRLRSLSCST